MPECLNPKNKSNLIAGNITNLILSGHYALASIRSQLIPAIQAASKIGLHPQIVALGEKTLSQIDIIGVPKICIIGKLSNPNRSIQKSLLGSTLKAIELLKKKEIPIITCYCDNLSILNTPLGELYRKLLLISDHIVFPCEAMATSAKEFMSKEQVYSIIKDPWQVKYSPFNKLNPSELCKIIWFGHPSNIKYLKEELYGLVERCNSSRNYELTILSDDSSFGDFKSHLEEYVSNADNWNFRFVPIIYGSDFPVQLEAELARAHLAIIPSDPNDPRKQAVSHNRIVDSIRSGCIVVASPMTSYLDLSKVSLIGKDIPKLVNIAFNQYEKITTKYGSIRCSLLAPFSPDVNHQEWLNLLNSLI